MFSDVSKLLVVYLNDFSFVLTTLSILD